MQALGCRRTGAALTLFLLSLTVLLVFGTSAGRVAAQDTQQLVWQGSVVSDSSGLTGGGTIIRVSVAGLAGLPIEVSSAHGGWSISVLSGSKPELGPYGAEVAGLSPGRYVIAPQGIGATVTVEADGTDVIVVQFAQVPAQAGAPGAAGSPVSGWEAEIVDVTTNLDLGGSVLRVSVEGQAGLLVEVSTPGGWSATGYTGTKPEYGDYVVEFAPLHKGDYIIRPYGLGAELRLWLDGGSYVFVEFRPRRVHTPSPTPTRPKVPSPASPVATGTPTAGVAPAATPVTVWSGQVVSNTSKEQYAGYLSAIQVIVEGMKGLPVEIRAGGWHSTAVTGSKPECGEFCLEFGGLSPSLYTITPQGLGVSVDVSVEGGGLALIKFSSRLVMPAVPSPTPTPGLHTRTPTTPAVRTPSTPTPVTTAVPQMVWGSRTLWNTSGPAPTGGFFSAIQVSVVGMKGLPVEIRSGGWSATARTGTKPECGEYCLEFAGLSGSTYTIIPQGLGIDHVVTVDGKGFAVVEFYQTPAQARPPVWTGRVVENISGGGVRGYFASIRVIVQGKKWLPVEISAGGWRHTAETGIKPECGGYCVEFGGLTPGTYTITPQGLGASVSVTVDEGGSAFVEFTAS